MLWNMLEGDCLSAAFAMMGFQLNNEVGYSPYLKCRVLMGSNDQVHGEGAIAGNEEPEDGADEVRVRQDEDDGFGRGSESTGEDNDSGREDTDAGEGGDDHGEGIEDIAIADI